MSNGRLVKVALPAKLVVQMDDYVTKSNAYAGRTEFVTDAVANLLADLHASSEEGVRWHPAEPKVVAAVAVPSEIPTVADVPTSEKPTRERMSIEKAVELATVRPPTDSVPTLDLDAGAHQVGSEPTWGMHNRDWPTIWAASMLGRLTADGPIEYNRFKEELVDAAWGIATVLKDQWDLSGFPSNESKAAQSEARFVEFFVGSQLGRGPLFFFGMALPKGSTEVVLADSGAELLAQLSGMTREESQPAASSQRLAFLRHLSRFSPADVGMLEEVALHVSAGDSTRVELIAAIQGKRPEWSGGTSSTNAAGYVGRAREWGIIEPKQVNHRYVINNDGVSDLNAVRAGIRDGGAS